MTSRGFMILIRCNNGACVGRRWLHVGQTAPAAWQCKRCRPYRRRHDFSLTLMAWGREIAATQERIDELQEQLRGMQKRFNERVATVRAGRVKGCGPLGRASVVAESLGQRDYRSIVRQWPKDTPRCHISASDLDWPAEDVPATHKAIYMEAIREYVSKHSNLVNMMLERVDIPNRCFWVRSWGVRRDGTWWSDVVREEIYVFRRKGGGR
jgi:hypothetical protein